MGKLYESQSDKDNEAEILKKFAEWSKSELQSCSGGAYPVDGLLKREGKVVAFVEARRRHNNHNKYPTLIWSLQKYVKVVQFSAILPTFFVVGFDDGIYWIQIKLKRYRVTFFDNEPAAGRDSRDNEPIIHIPVEEFTKLADVRPLPLPLEEGEE